MSNTADGPYVIEHGDVWHVSPLGRRRVCGPSETMAMAFDENDGTLHKHDTETTVRAWLDDFRSRMAPMGDLALPPPTLISFLPTEDTIAEMNLCIAISGRVKRLHERLSANNVALGRPTGP